MHEGKSVNDRSGVFGSSSVQPQVYEGERGDEVYPVFVNEAAYYEKGIAMMIGHRAEQPVRVLAAVSQSPPEPKRMRT